MSESSPASGSCSCFDQVFGCYCFLVRRGICLLHPQSVLAGDGDIRWLVPQIAFPSVVLYLVYILDVPTVRRFLCHIQWQHLFKPHILELATPCASFSCGSVCPCRQKLKQQLRKQSRRRRTWDGRVRCLLDMHFLVKFWDPKLGSRKRPRSQGLIERPPL